MVPPCGERTSVNRFLLCKSAVLSYSDRALIVSMVRLVGRRAHSDLSIRSAMSLRTEGEEEVSVGHAKYASRRTLNVVEWRGEINLPSLKTPVVFKVLDLATLTMSRPRVSARLTDLSTIEARIKVYEAVIDDWQRVHVFLCRYGGGKDRWGHCVWTRRRQATAGGKGQGGRAVIAIPARQPH